MEAYGVGTILIETTEKHKVCIDAPSKAGRNLIHYIQGKLVILGVGKLRFKEFGNLPTVSHTANKWQKQYLNSGLTDSEALVLSRGPRRSPRKPQVFAAFLAGNSLPSSPLKYTSPL